MVYLQNLKKLTKINDKSGLVKLDENSFHVQLWNTKAGMIYL
jgi:hypothetical protein